MTFYCYNSRFSRIFSSLIGLKINQNPDKNLYCATEFLQAIYLLCNITSDFRHEFCFIDFHVTRTNNRTNDHIDLSKAKPHAINSSIISRWFFGSKWAKNLQRKYLMMILHHHQMMASSVPSTRWASHHHGGTIPSTNLEYFD